MIKITNWNHCLESDDLNPKASEMDFNVWIIYGLMQTI